MLVLGRMGDPATRIAGSARSALPMDPVPLFLMALSSDVILPCG